MATTCIPFGVAMLEESVPRVKLPSGKEVTPLDAMKFCYNLSETDIEVLMLLMQGEKLDVESIASKLGLSKATVNRALNKLVALGFVERERFKRSGAGRPRYLYYVPDPKRVLDKIAKDFVTCADLFRKNVEVLLSMLSKSVERSSSDESV